MNLQAVLQKTEKGVEEIKTRGRGLEQRLRTLLIVVNGKTTGADLVKQFAQLGDVQPVLERLIAEGYVREAPVSAVVDFKEIRLQLSHSLTAAMGPAGDAIALQLEECKSMNALRTFVEARRPALEGAFGPRIANFFILAKSLLKDE
ncbi:MAG: hypothetical protein WCA01_01475 [Burkholderiales bacterium]|jgi:hypothetical protein